MLPPLRLAAEKITVGSVGCFFFSETGKNEESTFGFEGKKTEKPTFSSERKKQKKTTLSLQPTLLLMFKVP